VPSAFRFSDFRALGRGINPCLVTNSFVKLVALPCGSHPLFSTSRCFQCSFFFFAFYSKGEEGLLHSL
jgi:hypothetical protein